MFANLIGFGSPLGSVLGSNLHCRFGVLGVHFSGFVEVVWANYECHFGGVLEVCFVTFPDFVKNDAPH